MNSVRRSAEFMGNDKGFTLIELMIAVAIIGILASIAAGFFGLYMMKSKQSEAKELLSSIYTAESVYFAEKSTYDLPSVAGFAPSSPPRFYTNIGDANFSFTATSFTASCSTNLDTDAALDAWVVTDISRQPVNTFNDIL